MAKGIARGSYPTVLPEQILAYFDIDIDENNKAICPFHAETLPSLQVNKEYVYCFGCKWAGDVWKLAGELLKQHQIDMPVGIWFGTTDFPSPSGRTYRTGKYVGAVNSPLIEYWHNQLLSRSNELKILQDERLLTLDTIKKFQLGYRPDKNAWVIPFNYKGETEIVQFRSRETNESGKKYWGLEGHMHGCVINREVLDTPQEYVVVLLGAYDAVLAAQDGLSAVGLNGSMPFKKEEKEKVQQMFSKQSLIFVVPDNNEHEYSEAQKLAEWINAEVRYFPTELPHNLDYIDYRKSGKTCEDFKREVLGIVPDEDITQYPIYPSLCSLYDSGNVHEFATVHCELTMQGFSYSDVGIALAMSHVKDAVCKRQLLNVKCKEDFITAMQCAYKKAGGW